VPPRWIRLAHRESVESRNRERKRFRLPKTSAFGSAAGRNRHFQVRRPRRAAHRRTKSDAIPHHVSALLARVPAEPRGLRVGRGEPHDERTHDPPARSLRDVRMARADHERRRDRRNSRFTPGLLRALAAKFGRRR
jgi:hypothetical protein